ncbi:unnamed protein product [Jaminaea pallidilutea]
MTAVAAPPPVDASMSAEAGPSSLVSRGDAIQAAFDGYRGEIDAHNDRRERLIKASRDVTNLSKKLIFHLHRLPPPAHLSSADATLPVAAPANPSKMEKEAMQKRDEIVQLIKRVAFEEGLTAGSSASLRYERNFGSGVEEFIEAISFQHFLTHGTLVTLDEVQELFRIKGLEGAPETVQGPEGNPVEIPPDFLFPVPTHRYLLGISDLTGELMRFATNALGGGSGGAKGPKAVPSDPGAIVRAVLRLLRDIRESLEPFTFLVADMRKKQAVTTQSLRKIEDLSYNISIRLSEFGGDEKAIREMVRRALEGGSGGGPEPGDDE